MNSFYFMLQQIRKRPGLFLEKPSLIALDNFWSGYAQRDAIEVWQQKTGKDYFENYDEAIRTNISKMYGDDYSYFLDGFDEFVHSYYDHKMTTLNGTGLISKKSNSDEEAFDKFFELLDEFLKQK